MASYNFQFIAIYAGLRIIQMNIIFATSSKSTEIILANYLTVKWFFGDKTEVNQNKYSLIEYCFTHHYLNINTK